MDYSKKRDALRQANAEEYNNKPKINYPDAFITTSSPEQRKQISMILETAQKYKPYERKK